MDDPEVSQSTSESTGETQASQSQPEKQPEMLPSTSQLEFRSGAYMIEEIKRDPPNLRDVAYGIILIAGAFFVPWKGGPSYLERAGAAAIFVAIMGFFTWRRIRFEQGKSWKVERLIFRTRRRELSEAASPLETATLIRGKKKTQERA